MLANRKILGLGFQEQFFHDMSAGEQKYFSGILCQQQNCIYFFSSSGSPNVCHSGQPYSANVDLDDLAKY